MAGGEKVTPLVDFTGYPDGKRMDFKAGVEATVPAEYAAVLRSKGPKLVADKKPATTKASPAD